MSDTAIKALELATKAAKVAAMPTTNAVEILARDEAADGINYAALATLLCEVAQLEIRADAARAALRAVLAEAEPNDDSDPTNSYTVLGAHIDHARRALEV